VRHADVPAALLPRRLPGLSVSWTSASHDTDPPCLQRHDVLDERTLVLDYRTFVLDHRTFVRDERSVRFARRYGLHSERPDGF
jgi:hypothetical protein